MRHGRHGNFYNGSCTRRRVAALLVAVVIGGIVAILWEARQSAEALQRVLDMGVVEGAT